MDIIEECSSLLESVLEISNTRSEQCYQNFENCKDFQSSESFELAYDVCTCDNVLKACNNNIMQFIQNHYIKRCNNFELIKETQLIENNKKNHLEAFINSLKDCNNHRSNSFENALRVFSNGKCGDFVFFPADSISPQIKNPYIKNVADILTSKSHNPEFEKPLLLIFNYTENDNFNMLTYLTEQYNSNEVSLINTVFSDIRLKKGTLLFPDKHSPQNWHYDVTPAIYILIPLTEPGTEFCQLNNSNYYDIPVTFCNEQIKTSGFQIKNNEAVVYSTNGLHRVPNFSDYRIAIRAEVDVRAALN